MERFFQPRFFAAFAAALICLSYPEVVSGFSAFVLRDYGIFGYPLAAHQKAAFWAGELPLWNPHSCSGLPFLAQWNTMVLYPGSLIYLLGPMPWAHGVFMFAHQFLGAMGMYFLARRWTGSTFAAAVAGTIWGFNGLMLNSLMWPNNIAALGWMPWVVWAAAHASERVPTHRECARRIAIAALGGACQMLAGAPEVIGFTWVLATVAVVARFERGTISPLLALGKFATVVVLVALLCAAQLWPFLKLLSLSQRSADFGGAEWALPTQGAANFLVPLFRMYRSPQGQFFQEEQAWTTSYYFGLLPLALIPLWLSRKDRTWLWIAVLIGGFVLALGPAAKVWAWLKAALPLLGFIRFPIKFVVPIIFASAILAAFGTARLEAVDAAIRKRLVISGALLALLVAAIAVVSLTKPVRHEIPQAVLANAVLRVMLLAAAIGCALKFWKPAIVLLLAIDLLTHMPRQNTTAKSAVYEVGLTREGVLKEVTHGNGRAFQTRGAHDRFYFEMRPDPTSDYTGRRLGLYGDCNLIDQIPTPDGFYSLYVPWERAVWQRLFFAPTNAFPTGLAKFIGIHAMNSAQNPVEWVPSDFAPMPLLTAGQQVESLNENETLARLTDPSFDPTKRVFANLPPHESTRAGVTDVRAAAHSISAKVTAEKPTVAVLSQTWYPNWRATVNGKEIEIARANVAYQAIPIPAGESQIELRYEDRDFKFGAVISLCAALTVASMLLSSRRRTALLSPEKAG